MAVCIMYYWYKKKKDLAGSEMGKFNRILHSGIADDLMDEIPTFVVNPLPEGLDQIYILMAEPDHIFLKPLPNLSYEDYPAAFPFFYIKPTKYKKIIRKFFPQEKGSVINVDPIGNSPVIIQKNLLEKNCADLDECVFNNEE